MAIRRLSYRLVQEPDTGAVRPIPAEPRETHRESLPEPHQEPVGEFSAAVERIIGGCSALSYSLLPDGGRLLCAELRDSA